MKKLLPYALSLVMLLALTACSGNKESSEKENSQKPLDLSGEWIQTNSNSEDAWQEATITEDVIEINWISDNGDTKSLYWSGSFIAPTEAAESYSWTSKNDTSKTENALLASTAETKDFTYEDGILSYEASALGSTTVVKLERKSK
ncbi:hypothetical protein CYL18_04125 [Pradoshia eiseniae]|uniref:Lipocalin-like domain-containing protein n=1 Tax=Pradoshia eiseniae TaxID=2064768 RepID=A0A2S7N4V8_9BACI|nr:hypothetical protein [Pradoshia eiseniae]PQD97069.1 hypothetical protein CYL18_04125 [Pradoshia eiseniae]